MVMNDVPLRNPVRPRFTIEIDEATSKMLEFLTVSLAGRLKMPPDSGLRSSMAKIAISETFTRYVEDGNISQADVEDVLALIPPAQTFTRIEIGEARAKAASRV